MSQNDPLLGQTIADRYQVLELLGAGGMGRVYLAEHVRMGRKSALKVMSPALTHAADAISRFNREAANASRINHPNVAQIYDFGETNDGLLYLAMEYIEGETLTRLIEREGPLPIARAADITKQVSDALAAAHHLDIVHRDLKPENIMIARHLDGSDWVKVVDFGIAKTTQQGGGSQTVTTAGVSLGTPEYMSPEQLAGERLDQRSDIYSLGLVCFNMLTGDLPYPRLTSKETLVKRLTSPPRTLAEVRPEHEWPAALQAALDGALAPETSDRYPTVAEFGREIMLAAAGASDPERTVRIAAPSSRGGPRTAVPSGRTRPEAPRLPRGFAAMAAGLLVVVAVGAGAVVGAQHFRAGTAHAASATTAATVAAPPPSVAPPADSTAARTRIPPPPRSRPCPCRHTTARPHSRVVIGGRRRAIPRRVRSVGRPRGRTPGSAQMETPGRRASSRLTRRSKTVSASSGRKSRDTCSAATTSPGSATFSRPAAATWKRGRSSPSCGRCSRACHNSRRCSASWRPASANRTRRAGPALPTRRRQPAPVFAATCSYRGPTRIAAAAGSVSPPGGSRRSAEHQPQQGGHLQRGRDHAE